MDNFSIGKILSGFGNNEIFLKKLKNVGINTGDNSSFSSAFSQAKPLPLPHTTSLQSLVDTLQMNQIASTDRSIYIKTLLGLPQTLSELLRAVQNKTPVEQNTLLINNLNEDVIKNQKILSEIFDENIETLPAIMQNTQQNALPKDAASLIFGGMIHMPAVSEMILKNSKQAVANLIIAMASSSKNGMTNEQIQETLSVINSCVAMAESGNPAQTLKSLMMLYLPWLPLNEGVGFDLEVETQSGENESNDSKLTVLIQTINFGNVKGVFTLTTSNSVDAYIICNESFPKSILKKQLMEEGQSHSMNTEIDIEEVEEKKEAVVTDKRETKVNLSATNEMNPYLLLMAHSFIRIVIQIDSNAIIENSTT